MKTARVFDGSGPASTSGKNGVDAGVCLGFISTETGPNWRNATKHKNPGSLTAQHFAGIHGNWRNKTIIIRNQQVRCSSHPTSSKKHRKLRFSVLFCCKNAENGASQNVGQLPDPHRDPHAERVKEYRRGGFAPSPIFLMCFFCSHHLCHKTAHRLCSFILLLPCGVGVGSQGKACIIVPQHTADRFHVHTVL